MKKENIKMLVDVEISYEETNKLSRKEAIKAAEKMHIDTIGCGVHCGLYSAKSKKVKLYK